MDHADTNQREVINVRDNYRFDDGDNASGRHRRLLHAERAPPTACQSAAFPTKWFDFAATQPFECGMAGRLAAPGVAARELMPGAA